MIRSKLHTLLESYTDDTPLRRDLMSDPLFYKPGETEGPVIERRVVA